MQMREIGNALVIALISVVLMVGALSISLVEFVPEATPTATYYLLPTPIPVTVTQTFPPTFTSIAPSVMPTFTNTVAMPPSACQVPYGWNQTMVRVGDTLDVIATRYRVSKNELRISNCLLSENLVAGSVLYVPAVATNTPATCNSGASGWIKTYTVKTGDTFYNVATAHYTSAGLLKSVNCRTSDLIYAGETLWIPNVATRTPYPTPLPGVTITPQPTDPLTETALPFTVTVLPSSTPTPVSTNTITPTFTPIVP